MKILAIDTSTKMGSVALCEEEKLIAQYQMNIEVTHAEKLLPTIETVLKAAQWNFSDINGLALSIGPGSFTGLRIGLATMKGFAQAHQLPLVGVSSLLALAYNACLSEKPVVSVLDARRGEVYAAITRFKNGNLDKILMEEQAIAPNLLHKTLEKIGPYWVVGDSGCVIPATWKSFLRKQESSGSPLSRGGIQGKPLDPRFRGDDRPFFPPSYLNYLQAKWVAFLALPLLKKGEGKNWMNLTPNYLRPSDAEK